MLSLIERWLIRKNYYHLAEEEFKNHALRYGAGYRDFSEYAKSNANNQWFLLSAFDWSKTKQGLEFWVNVYHECNQYLEKWKYSTTSRKK